MTSPEVKVKQEASVDDKENAESAESQHFSRHPLFITIVGFFLTGLIGAFVTSRINERQLERSIILEQRQNRVSSAEQFINQLMSRRTRAELIIAALDRDKAINEEILRRKLEYDEAYFVWNSNIDAHLLKIEHDFLQRDSIEFIEIKNFLETNIVRYLLRPIDGCIESAMILWRAESDDANKKKSDLDEIIKNCGYFQLRAKLRSCSHNYSKAIWALANRPDGWRMNKNNVYSECNIETVRQFSVADKRNDKADNNSVSRK